MPSRRGKSSADDAGFVFRPDSNRTSGPGSRGKRSRPGADGEGRRNRPGRRLASGVAVAQERRPRGRAPRTRPAIGPSEPTRAQAEAPATRASDGRLEDHGVLAFRRKEGQRAVGRPVPLAWACHAGIVPPGDLCQELAELIVPQRDGPCPRAALGGGSRPSRARRSGPGRCPGPEDRAPRFRPQPGSAA